MAIRRPDKEVGALVDELRTMVTDYVRQETIEPAKNLGKAFAFSLASGVLFGSAFSFMLFGLLRFLQAKVWVFPEGAWTWVPYLVTTVAGAIVIAITMSLMSKGKKKTRDAY